MNSATLPFDLVDLSALLTIFAPFICVLVIVYVARRTLTRRSAVRTKQSPALLVAGIQEELFDAYSGSTPAGYHIDYYVMSASLFSDRQTKGLYMVELPFLSGVHLIGLPKASATSPRLSAGSFEPVTLEGDYPDYFRLFAATGQDADTQYILDPKAMAFTVDFCRQFDWEILDDTLYFYSAEQLPSFAVIDQFIDEIRPAIETKSTRRTNPYRMSYTNTSIRTMLCPRCQAKLEVGESWLACPAGHGYLVTGEQLSALRDDISDGTILQDVHSDPLPPIHCPYCHNPMTQAYFGASNVVIDVCSRCMYRWVDSNETRYVFGKQL